MSRDHLSDGNKNGAFKKQFGFWVLQQQRPKAPYYVDVGCIVIYIGFGAWMDALWMEGRSTGAL